MLGPWTGHLNNEGGAVRLLRPAPSALAAPPVDGNGDLPYETVDEVEYSSSSPWPVQASGAGQSLTRRDDRAYGNDPSNWLSAAPTPGDADTDADELGDQWELANGLKPNSASGDDGANGDPDHDGMTNRQELLAGTLPRDASSRLELHASATGAGVATLTFSVPPGRSCTLQFRENLNSGAWQNLRAVLGWPDGQAVTITENFTGATRYYRLLMP